MFTRIKKVNQHAVSIQLFGGESVTVPAVNIDLESEPHFEWGPYLEFGAYIGDQYFHYTLCNLTRGYELTVFDRNHRPEIDNKKSTIYRSEGELLIALRNIFSVGKPAATPGKAYEEHIRVY